MTYFILRKLPILPTAMISLAITGDAFARSKTWDVIGPDKQNYNVSMTVIDDAYGPAVTLVVNMPVDGREASMQTIANIASSLIQRECSSKGMFSSVKYIEESSRERTYRYKHKGKNRVAWSFNRTCIRK